ncbi:MAG: hypothetical protein LQ345_003456 [Seirophora villosa]|nr:MAG: hypothetical protein LQ345_003456 [Seirophora villosa]
MRVFWSYIYHLYNTLFLLLLFRQVQTLPGASEGLQLASKTGLARASDPPDAAGDVHPSTQLLQSPKRISTRDAVANAPPNPVTIFQDWHAIEPSESAIAALVDLYDHVEKSLPKLGTELSLDQNNSLIFSLGSIQLTVAVENLPSRKLPRMVSTVPTPEDCLSEMVKKLRDQVLRGLPGIGKVFILVRNFFILSGIIAVLAPNTRQLPGETLVLPQII